MFGSKIKYIVVDNITNDCLYIFPDFISHAEFANRFKYEKIISAGFVDIKNKCCFGESISLKLKSREIDTKLLDILLRED